MGGLLGVWGQTVGISRAAVGARDLKDVGPRGPQLPAGFPACICLWALVPLAGEVFLKCSLILHKSLPFNPGFRPHGGHVGVPGSRGPSGN